MIEKLFKLSELITLPGCNFNYHEGEEYACELNKLLYHYEELRDLLFHMVLQECATPDNTVSDYGVKLYQDAIDYFKEIGWISPSGQIWKKVKV